MSKSVKRVTTVLEDDVVGNEVTNTNGKVHVQKIQLTETMQKDIDTWLKDFGNVVCTEPGLTNWVELDINTGDASPVAQHPYNTPVALREAVSNVIDWLLEKGYVGQSQSEWGSPIVVARKPDGSICLCIDYKKLNSVTTPAPFYMPTIEEILEAAGMWRERLHMKTGSLQSYWKSPGRPRWNLHMCK